MRVFFCGTLASISYASWQRSEVLRQAGFDVSTLDFTSLVQPGLLTRIRKQITRSRFVYPEPTVAAFNREFISRVEALRPQIVWAEKALLLLPKTLERVRRIVPDATLVCCQEDNPFGHRREEIPIWRNFLACISHYDLHLTKRSGDIEPFQRHGAKRVAVIRQGFFPALHHPPDPATVGTGRHHEVVFVGTPHDHRVGALRQLIESGLPVHVYGGLWNRHAVYYRHRHRFHGPLIGPAYAEMLAGSKISLGYVSWSNLDEYTVRSLEIPACGGFLLAERTPTHQQLYEEGVEAEFFASTEECMDKIRFYLGHDSARERIARAGHRRCLASDYSLQHCMRDAMEQVADVRGAAIVQ